MGMIFPDLIAVDLTAEDADDAIRKVGSMFQEQGFVKETYIDAVTAREKEYPTGLMLRDIGVAMPHTDPGHVIKAGICVVKLAKPVEFAHMGMPETKVAAEMIFMMAIVDPNAQIETLQKVLTVFQNPEAAAEFKAAPNAQALYQVALKHIQ